MSHPAFRKILVANRAEIAVRVCRTLRAMGIPSVAVYSEADRGALHVRAADEAVCLGPAAPAESYLNVGAILAAARDTGADAIHPGYGFLSQSAPFARACGEAGVTFIGPSAESMEILGDKASSRRTATRCGVPTIPGVEGVADVDEALMEAKRLGYPVLLKAVGGGGGRGMRRAATSEELRAAFDGARREAQTSFGDDRLFLEKLVHPARHVEIQVLGDGRDAIALGERECSLQRRYQKVIEESPCAVLEDATRTAMEGAAVALAREARYAGAGTVEFLLGPDGAFYFLEVNTRLQVEHPVTEMRTGVDLVRAQIEIAAGGPLPVVPAPRGHAIEARLNAEDPYHDYLPQTGRVLMLDWPRGEGVRVDAGIAKDQSVHAHYDSLLAKVIAHGADREEARHRLIGALESLVLLGVTTNQSFLLDLLRDEVVTGARTFTHTLESKAWPGPSTLPDEAFLAAAVALHAPPAAATEEEGADRFTPWLRVGRWGRAIAGGAGDAP